MNHVTDDQVTAIKKVIKILEDAHLDRVVILVKPPTGFLAFGSVGKRGQAAMACNFLFGLASGSEAHEEIPVFDPEEEHTPGGKGDVN